MTWARLAALVCSTRYLVIFWIGRVCDSSDRSWCTFKAVDPAYSGRKRRSCAQQLHGFLGSFKAKNADDAFEVVRKNVQAHLTCHVLEASGQEVR